MPRYFFLYQYLLLAGQAPVSRHLSPTPLMAACENHCRKRPAPAIDIFIASRGCPLTRALTVILYSNFILKYYHTVADLGELPPPPPLLFWVKKEEMAEGRKAGWASKVEPGSLLSSKPGSTTVTIRIENFNPHTNNTIRNSDGLVLHFDEDLGFSKKLNPTSPINFVV